MATCKTEEGLFLTEELYNRIVDTHSDLQISGLTYSEQKEVVSFISNKMYRESLVSEGIYKLSDLKKFVHASITETIKNNTRSIEMNSLNEAEAEDNRDIIATLTEINKTLNLVLNNIDKLVTISRKHLSNIQGIKVIETELDYDITDLSDLYIEYKVDNVDFSPYFDSTNVDLSSIYTDYSDIDAERTTFNDNFSLQIDSKSKIGGKLKTFLNFVQRKRFRRSGKTRDLKTFFGTEDYMSYDEVYDELHRLVEGVYPNYESLIKRLEEKYEEAQVTKNNSLAWLDGLIEQLKDPNIVDKTTQRMFVRDMAKHKAIMEYVSFKGEFNNDGKYKTRLTIAKDNTSTAGIRLNKAWQTAHTKSNIVAHNGEYDKEKLFQHGIKLDNVLKTYESNTAKITIKHFLEDIGVNVPDTFIEAITDDKLTIYTTGKAKYSTGERVIGALLTELKLMSGPVNNSILASSFFVGLANEAAKFNPNEFGNVFRVADKLVYTYTNNHFLFNRTRDLKTNKAFRKQLESTSFSEYSPYLKLLNEGIDEDFTSWFDMGYVSLATLLKKTANGYNRSKGFTTLPDVDLEITKIAFTFRNNKKLTKIIGGNEFTVSKGTSILPTISDKTRAVTLNGYTFHVTDYSHETVKRNKKLLIEEKENPYSFDESSINLYYQTVVQAEISRIQESSNQDFLNSLDLVTEGDNSTYKGDLFYMTPYLNNLYLDVAGNKVSEGAEGSKSLVDMIIDGNNYAIASETIKAAIDQDLMRKAEDRYTEWERLGLIEEGVLKHKNDKNSFKSNLGNIPLRAMEAAIDITFTEEFNHVNTFQLIIGDPAQFFKKNIQGTYGNITKRLAAIVAPGDEADYSDEPDYVQVFLNDRVSTSKTIDTIMQELDGIKYKTFLNWRSKISAWYQDNPNIDVPPEDIQKLELKIAGLQSLAYTEIESTDAQEYVTWKTHLKEMLRYGELTDNEYQQMYDTIKNGKDLKGKDLVKVLGPRKPVYANTEIQKLGGSGRNFYRHTYIKSSTFPLLPQLVRGQQLEKFADAMDALENKSDGRSVRAAYKTAAKVGFPENGITVFDENGDVFENLNLESGSRVLQTSGLRIQQAVPYKEKKKTTLKGAQEAKLLFTNLLGFKFKFEGSTISGTELQDIYNQTYHELYKLGYEKLKGFILGPEDENKERTLDNNKLSTLLLQELNARDETSKPLRDGLKVDPETGIFTLPLWESDYADNYMSLINSIIKKFVLKKEMPGGSAVLGSEEGFKVWEEEGKELVEGEADIVFSENYNPEIGLQGQREDPETGEILPAQILLPLKFTDKKGNFIDPKTLIIKGTNKIDQTKLPDELRENFVFRIPTQLQQSMAYVEVVGFLPQAMGDLVIAPKDFVVQMGSDFDVDKLYNYMYNAEFVEGVLTKIAYTEDKGNKDFKKGLQNRIMDIHKTIMLNKNAQPYIKKPLDLNAKGFQDIGNFVESMRSDQQEEIDSVISHKYNKKKLNDGAAGNDGIAIFSSDSILNALSQGKGLIISKKELIERVDEKPYTIRKDIKVSFGNSYEISNGEIGITKNLKKGSNKSPADMISASQTLSVDNAVLEVMSKINMNTDTANVYTLLHILGFEEDITANFMSQPILFDYIKELRNTRGMFSDYDPNAQDTILEKLRQKYDPNNTFKPEDIILADFNTYPDAALQMSKMIEKGEDYGEDFGIVQMSIFYKFMYLQEYAEKLPPLKSLLNIDSKGLDKNFYNSKTKLELVAGLDTHHIRNAEKLLEGTLAGFDVDYGLDFLVNTFGNHFIETDPKFRFTKVVATLERTIDRTLSDAEIYDLRNNIVHYMHNNLENRDIDSLRELLFKDTSDNSFYSKLVKLKESSFGKNNQLLKNISIDINQDNVVIINYDRISGDKYDDTAVYMSLVNMLTTNIVLDNEINPSEVAQQLIYYTLIKGGRKGTSLKKYIPADVLKEVVDTKITFNEIHFLEQYLQNNPGIVNNYTAKNVKKLPTKEEEAERWVLNTKQTPVAITVEKGTKLLLRNKEGEYIESPIFEGTDITVYTGQPFIEQPVINNDHESIDENSGTLVTAVYNGEINTLEDLYNNIDATGLSEDKILLLNSLSKLSNQNTPVIIRPLDPNIYGIYTNEGIVLNKDKLEENILEEEDMIIAVMHEHLHSLTYQPIDAHFTAMGKSESKVGQSIDRIDEFMNEHLEGVLGSKDTKEDFLNFLELEYSSLNEDTLKVIRSTIHNKDIKLLVEDAILNIRNSTPLSPDTLSSLNTSVEKIEREGNFKYYYALSSIYEFIAITPTELTELSDKLNTKRYKSVITELFANLLEMLGITGNLKGLLNDIYTVANVIPQTIEPQPYMEKAFMYRDESAVYNKDKKAYVCCANSNRVLATKTDEVFSDYTNSLYETYRGKDLDWFQVDFNTLLEDTQLRDENLPVDPVAGVFTLIQLEQEPKDYTEEINKLKRTLGIAQETTVLEPVTNEEIEKAKVTKVKPDTVYSKNKELNSYLTNMAKYATGIRGTNVVSAELSKSDDLGKMTDDIEFKSLKVLGRDLIEKCGGTTRSGRKWTTVNGRPMYNAKNGLAIPKTKQFGKSNKWELFTAKAGMKYEHGAVIKSTRKNKSSKWEKITTLKGPSHTQGGIDISIGNGKVSLMKGQTELTAKCGLYMPAKRK